ncbi:TaqI-like C-terminal specificity domain-containing protein [Chryseobacterium indologenes]|uniref:TaqI-like C-terminal specificity domain-containing protein n=1 Tax=Chryseobacterium indologenes TaxID=253 RepID=UPI001BCE9034|nr:TaqI-like C-terminal specificity domain-containing protein [Chryseobacterium indologenes]
MSDYFRQNSVKANFSSSDSWVILSDIEQRIKAKIEAVGTPLKEWDINIYRGILTGYNEAFIIDKKKKDELIAEDPKSAEIIRPILRGRDIKRYAYEATDLWLINTHNGIKEKGVKAIDINDYPIVKKHLDLYYPQLSKRTDKGDTPYNLRNCAYMEDFYRPKIVWIELTNNPNFCLDKNNYLLNNTIFFISGERLEYLVSYLNSNVCKWYFTKLAATSGVGTTRWIKIYIEQLRVPMRIDPTTEELFTNLAKEIQTQKSKNINTDYLENLVNQRMYNLFELNDEEISFIESQ